MRRNRRERGEGQLGCLVGLIFLALGVFIAFKMVPVKVSVIVTLLSTAAGLAILVPLAIPFVWLLFVTSAGFGQVERSRARDLLGIDIRDPHEPLPEGAWYWKRRGHRWSTW